MVVLSLPDTYLFHQQRTVVIYAPVMWTPPPPPPTHTPRAWPGESGDNHLMFISLCFPEGELNTRFHFFIAWFWDGSKSSGGGSEQTTSSSLKIRLTSSQMSGEFTFNLSVVAFSCCLVIWPFDINYLRSLRSRFKNALQGLVRGFKKGCQTLVCTAEYLGVGTSLSIFAPVSGNFMSPPCPGWGSNDWCNGGQ